MAERRKFEAVLTVIYEVDAESPERAQEVLDFGAALGDSVGSVGGDSYGRGYVQARGRLKEVEKHMSDRGH